MSLPVGTVVQRRKGPVMHKGVIFRLGWVWSSTPERGEHVIPLVTFIAGQSWWYELPTPTRARLVAHRVPLLARTPRAYDLLCWNCEHTVANACGELVHSPQVVDWLRGALLGAAVAGIALARRAEQAPRRRIRARRAA